MSSRVVRSNPSASDGEPEDVEDTSESKWRSSIRKKMARLGKKTRPISLNLDARRGSRDDAIRLSSQSLYLPSYSPPPPLPPPSSSTEKRDGLHRQKFGSLLSSKPFSQDEESSGKRFLKKMFPLKKSNSATKVDFGRDTSQIDLNCPSANTRTLENIPEKGRLKEAPKQEGIHASHFKLRFRKFVTRGTFTAGIASFSTRFRDRLLSTQSTSFYENDKDLSRCGTDDDTLESVERINRSFRPKSNSISQPCSRLSSNYEQFAEGLYDRRAKHIVSSSPFNEEIESIRYIDSSSEEDVGGFAQKRPSTRVAGLVRNEVLSSSFQGEYRSRNNVEWLARRSLYLKEEIRSDLASANGIYPDKKKTLEDLIKEPHTFIESHFEMDSCETSETSQVEASVSSTISISGKTPSNQVQLDIAIEANVLPQDDTTTSEEASHSESISGTSERTSESVYEANLNEILENNDTDVFDSLKDISLLGPILEQNTSEDSRSSEAPEEGVRQLDAKEDSTTKTSIEKDNHEQIEKNILSVLPLVNERLSNTKENVNLIGASETKFPNLHNVELKKIVIAYRNLSEYFDYEYQIEETNCSFLIEQNRIPIVNNVTYNRNLKFSLVEDSRRTYKGIPDFTSYNPIVNSYEHFISKPFNETTILSPTREFLPTVKLFDVNYSDLPLLSNSFHRKKDLSNFSLCIDERFGPKVPKKNQNMLSIYLVEKMTGDGLSNENKEVPPNNEQTNKENDLKKTCIQNTNINLMKGLQSLEDMHNRRSRRKRKKKNGKNKSKTECKIETSANKDAKVSFISCLIH